VSLALAPPTLWPITKEQVGHFCGPLGTVHSEDPPFSRKNRTASLLWTNYRSGLCPGQTAPFLALCVFILIVPDGNRVRFIMLFSFLLLFFLLIYRCPRLPLVQPTQMLLCFIFILFFCQKWVELPWRRKVGTPFLPKKIYTPSFFLILTLGHEKLVDL
jgi:hypothetical protein